jgi:hypothetical protein
MYSHIILRQIDAEYKLIFTNENPMLAFKPNSLDAFISSSIVIKKLRFNFDYGLWKGKMLDNALANDGKGFKSSSRENIRISVGVLLENKTKTD